MAKIIPESGKWYVSERDKLKRRDATGTDTEPPYPGAHNVILGGPFDSKDEAKQAIEENSDWDDPYPWLNN